MDPRERGAWAKLVYLKQQFAQFQLNQVIELKIITIKNFAPHQQIKFLTL